MPMTTTEHHRSKAAWVIYGDGYSRVEGMREWIATGEHGGGLAAYARMAEALAWEFECGRTEATREGA